MQRLQGEIKNYDWGSTTRLAELRGDTASGVREAEVWFGAHPGAPSLLGEGGTLLDAIAGDPVGQLGHDVVDAFGSGLPFLVKLLAADAPLSIQAHPNREQALAGFAAEDAAGIDRAAPNRNFRDENPKPELIVALSRFEALVGFREPDQTKAFFDAIGFARLVDVLDAGGPKAVVERVLSANADVDEVQGYVTDLVRCCAQHSGTQHSGTAWQQEAALIARLEGHYTGDPGVLVASLLNYVVLDPGESIFLEAGIMHSYIGGLAVEVMANSDNVLRGGLTKKHVDVTTLLDIVTPEPAQPFRVMADSDGVLQTPAIEFSVRRHDRPAGVEISGPQVVLCVEGSIEVVGTSEAGGAERLTPAEAVWVAHGEAVTLSGNGRCFSTTVGPVATLQPG